VAKRNVVGCTIIFNDPRVINGYIGGALFKVSLAVQICSSEVIGGM